jgi:glycosyltransferase involved in cell wall biosynthesis
MGLPQETIADMFIVMVNAANMSQPSRKNFAAAIEAWSMFWRGLDTEWRDRAYLYLHTDRSGSIWNGEELNRHIKLFDAKNVLFPPQYQYIMGMIGTDRLSYLYNSADVLLCTSRGEGFGLPLIEAQACGVPVIAPDFDATAELAAKGTTIGGTLCSLKAGTQEIMVDTRKTAIALFGAWQRWRAMQCNCDTEDIQEIADWAYDNYSIQIVTEQFLQPLVNRIESNISQQEAPQKT